MALGMVQAGYKNSLYWYTAGICLESECSYEEWLAELTTELELALEGGAEEEITDSDNGADSLEEDKTTESYSNRKKEWEELLDQAKVVDAMLRQMMENGLGQQKEEQQNLPKKRKTEELDNEFEMAGISMAADGKSKSSIESQGLSGNSKSLQTNTGHGAEYFSRTNGGRQLCERSHVICLTCETECDRKKLWKIVE